MAQQFQLFLSALAEGLTVSGACKRAGIARTTAYAHRRDNPIFAEAWDDASAAGVDALIDEMRRRAVEGVERRVFYQGECIDVVREYSDSLLLALAKARMPELFRERYDINSKVIVDHAAEILDARRRAGVPIGAPDASPPDPER